MKFSYNYSLSTSDATILSALCNILQCQTNIRLEALPNLYLPTFLTLTHCNLVREKLEMAEQCYRASMGLGSSSKAWAQARLTPPQARDQFFASSKRLHTFNLPIKDFLLSAQKPSFTILKLDTSSKPKARWCSGLEKLGPVPALQSCDVLKHNLCGCCDLRPKPRKRFWSETFVSRETKLKASAVGAQ